MPPSPGFRSPKDSMKNTILKESTSGWSNAISPLRISKREGGASSNDTAVEQNSPSKGLARRQSNSFKHVWNNNLVSKSPFKSQIPTSMHESTVTNKDNNSPRVPRKTSGEKRPRPESLIKQAEIENEQRTRELGFNRRQSKAFMGLVEKEPVTKSPFKRIVSPIPNSIASTPIPIALNPSLASITDDDTTSLEEDANYDPKKNNYNKNIFSNSYSSAAPVRPFTPQTTRPPSRSPNMMSRNSPIQVSPLPSASQPSPTRSSLVNKRLIGPRSVSNSPLDTPRTRERRKTVTFDEQCEVVEFDQESHENMSFTTDDEVVYGHPSEDEQTENNFIVDNKNDDSDDSYEKTPKPPSATWSRHDIDFSTAIGDDSINGLVASILQEASTAHSPEPSTPNQHNIDFTNSGDLINGGDEDGIPHGRFHHSDRNRLHRGQSAQQSYQDKELPGTPESDTMADAEDEPSFSSISLSTPPQQSSLNAPRHDPPILPPDTEEAEDGMPLGRSHHAERASKARRKEEDPEIDKDVKMLPPSPSPLKRPVLGNNKTNLSEGLVPIFDLGVPSNLRKEEHSRTLTDELDDVFNVSGQSNLLDEDFEAEFNRSVLSNTSIASFHEIPPHDAHNHYPESDLLNRKDPADRELRFEDLTNSSINHSDIFLPRIRSLENVKEKSEIPWQPTSRSSNDLEFGRAQPTPSSRESYHGVNGPEIVLQEASLSFPSTSPGSLGRSPRITREAVRRKLEEKRNGGNTTSPSIATAATFASPLLANGDYVSSGSQTHSPLNPTILQHSHSQSPTTSKPSRSPLQDRLRNALSSPPAATSSPLPPTDSPLQISTDAPTRPPMPIRAETYDVSPRPPFDFNQPGVQIGDMKSALDRLVDDVNTGRVTNSKYIDDADISMADTNNSFHEDEVEKQHSSRSPVEQAQIQSDLSSVSNSNSALPATSAVPPPVPEKNLASNLLEERDRKIKEIRRRLRARDSGEFIPARRAADGTPIEDLFHPSGRPSRRRSLSTGDAEDLTSQLPAAQRRVSILKNQLGGVLGIPLESEEQLADSIEEELRKLDGNEKKSYHLKEHEETIYASSSAEESISHMSRVGDLDVGKAWRTVRRPSDMNEYSRQIKEYQSQTKPGKALGKVFVKVLGIKSLTVPLPAQTTVFTCTLNNGIHFVSTPECRLNRESAIEQEFELIEHAKLEFTLTLKIRRDPHIVTQMKAIIPPPPPPSRTSSASAITQSKSGVVRSFFGATPKRPKQLPREATPPPPPTLPENLARYLKPDGTLARAFISFKEIGNRCDTRLFETSFRLIGQRLERAGGPMVPAEIGEIVLQLFRLPPLPGIPLDQLPLSLEECHRGLRHISWHKVTYHEGTLTQIGADCTTWRRRRLRIIGSNLVAFNDVTKRATATIDLKKAIAVEDDQEVNPRSSHSIRDIDEFDGAYGVERSFRLIFPNKQEITFFADTDEEKSKWLEVLRALVGRIPPNPLWAELLWQRQEENAKSSSFTRQTPSRQISMQPMR